MYRLPLTMYLVAWRTGRGEYATDHFRGHAWAYLFGWGEWGAIACDAVGQLLIVIGAALGIIGWRQIYRGQGRLVCAGLYRHIRHPQYTGFFLFLMGSIINWPTLITLLMLPVLLVVYYRLAKQEEADALAHLGVEYRWYRETSGMFWPPLKARARPPGAPREHSNGRLGGPSLPTTTER